MKYYQDEPCTILNMKFETLVVVGEFKDDYDLTEDQIQAIIKQMHDWIDSNPISNWDEFAQGLDIIFKSMCPKVFS